jgi:queuine tRNA-ribosyltransferase
MNKKFMKNIFKITHSSKKSSARTGVLKTQHGKIETPFFMPIATYGAVKTQSSDEIKDLPSNILLSNTYHLYIRPGTKILEEAGGLHKFMNWNQIILTDSGGYQVYSLQGMRKITDDGVTFQSHLDGSKHHFTPEKVVDIQRSIGSDIMMMLDVCPPGDANKKKWVEALNITTKWALRAKKHYDKTEPLYGHYQIISPIVQGGTDLTLRKQSAMELIDINCDMYAIGGLAVGEPKEEMLKVVHFMDTVLPKEKPRYLMGVGTPADLVESILNGIDMFDCVIPTRNARNSQLFSFDGKINIRNAKYKNDFSPIDKNNFSLISNKYSKAYLHHLFKTNEVLGLRIATEHNLKFYIHLMQKTREKIKENCFEAWAKEFLKGYNNE